MNTNGHGSELRTSEEAITPLWIVGNFMIANLLCPGVEDLTVMRSDPNGVRFGLSLRIGPEGSYRAQEFKDRVEFICGEKFARQVELRPEGIQLGRSRCSARFDQGLLGFFELALSQS